MPDKWEYPWYASWDLAFHCIPFALIDAEFAKHQLVLLTREWYMHPNGQIPAYEWAFGDVNPPVHAWAAWRVYQIDRKQNGGQRRPRVSRTRLSQADAEFHLVGEPQGRSGRNIFQGGFLGLDNIGVFDRSAQLPDRRLHRPVGRHQLDGDVCAEPDAHRAGARAAQPCVRGHRQQVLRAFPEDRRGHESMSRRRSACGTRRTSSSTTC